MDSSPPGSSVYGVSQARLVEWVAMASSRKSSWPRDQTRVSCIGEQIFFLPEPPGKPMGRQSWKPVNAIKGDIRKDLNWNNKISVQIEISKLLLSSNLNEVVIFFVTLSKYLGEDKGALKWSKGRTSCFVVWRESSHYIGLFWITLAFLSLVKKWQKTGCPWNDSFKLEIIPKLWT